MRTLAAERLGEDASVSGNADVLSNGEPLPLWAFVDPIMAAVQLPKVQRSLSAPGE